MQQAIIYCYDITPFPQNHSIKGRYRSEYLIISESLYPFGVAAQVDGAD
jgi:hypothetical protein